MGTSIEKRFEKQEASTKGMRTAVTEEKVATIDELIGPLSHEGQKQTHCSTRQLFKKMVLIQSSIVQIIHRDLGLKCLVHLPKCLLPITVSFSNIYILHRSVATQLRCGEIFNNHFIASCPQIMPVKEF